MKAVIVEDELIAAQNLQRVIGQVAADIQVIAVLQSVEESVEWFSLNPAPDLCLWIFIWPTDLRSVFLKRFR